MVHIQKTPQQVTASLDALFKKYNVQEKITVAQVKEWIWNATGQAMEALNKYHKKCFQLFLEPKDINEMNEIMQVFTDAWNYFPHKELGGRDPNDIMQEELKKAPQDQSPSRSMPKVIVGNREMEWEEYKNMLKEMERAQKPFKKWIYKDALPKYQKYLEQTVKNRKIREELYEVADIFFQRVLDVGFVTFQEIRPAFIQKDFPRWWPTHVMYSNLEPPQVQESLGKLFAFIELVYGMSISTVPLKF